MFFGYLGPLLIRAGDTEAPIASPRQRTVLAVLLARAGRPVTVDELAEFVWDGRPPRAAADTLRSYVMRLRRALGPAAGSRIVTRDPGYLIEAADEEVDALRFARACRAGGEACRAGQWASASAILASGLGLWRADPLADVPSQLLRDAEVPPLLRLRGQALQWRIDADLRLGGGEELVAELHELVAREPLREQLNGLLITALAQCGRAGEALAAYRQARDALVAELGIEPGPQLRELQRRILAGERILPDLRPAAIQVASGPSGQGAASGPRPLPRQLSAAAAHFAGRTVELKLLDAALDQARDGAATVTISAISGMAGIGKTTLALYWAHQVAGRFPDGQLYVNLRGFGPAAPMAAADALRGFLDALRDPAKPLPPDLNEQEALYRSLTGGRRILVVLDNARDEEQVRPLLPGSAGCLTLITSRNQLAGLVATNGAVPLTLDLLTGTEAHELLTRRLGPERIAAESAAADQLVKACTGLPLALSIAAARAALTPGLPLAALSAELTRRGLDALSGIDPYADLRSVFSWSYARLSPDAARLFRCLPSFPGPDVSADAAASIAPAGRTGELLTELTSAHLLEEYVPGRFRLHDLLARYAQERAEQEDTEDARRESLRRVLSWYNAAATMMRRILTPNSPHIRHDDQPDPVPASLAAGMQAMEWLEAERRNLVAAVGLAARLGFDTIAVTLPLVLWGLFEQRRYLHDWLDTNVIGIEAAHRTGDLDAEAHLYISLSRAYVALGRAEDGITGLHRAIAIRQAQGDLPELAALRLALSIVYFEMGRVTEAVFECEQAAAMARESGDLRNEAHALSDLGEMHQRMAQPEKALGWHLAAQAIAAQILSPILTGAVQSNLASTYLELGRNDEATVAAKAAIELNEKSGNLVEQANAHRVLGDAFGGLGQDAQARSHWRTALAIYRDLGDPQADDVAAKLGSGT
jgi:DNA-binding SARP family transcriptional activator/tetratricopeptide (TPR) repeat protein